MQEPNSACLPTDFHKLTTFGDDSLLKSFLELTFANELELAQSDPVLVDQTRTAIAPLFSRCQGLVSDSAFAYFFDVYEVSDR